jgi:hypothetical protein
VRVVRFAALAVMRPRFSRGRSFALLRMKGGRSRVVVSQVPKAGLEAPSACGTTGAGSSLDVVCRASLAAQDNRDIRELVTAKDGPPAEQHTKKLLFKD